VKEVAPLAKGVGHVVGLDAQALTKVPSPYAFGKLLKIRHTCF